MPRVAFQEWGSWLGLVAKLASVYTFLGTGVPKHDSVLVGLSESIATTPSTITQPTDEFNACSRSNSSWVNALSGSNSSPADTFCT